MKILAGVFLLGSLFSSKAALAQGQCFSSANVSGSVTICSGATANLLLTGVNGGLSGAGPWSANYQWDSSTDGGTTWYPIPGASGIVGATTSLTAGYTTSALTGAVSYRVQLTSIVGACDGITTTYNTNSVLVNVNPVPGNINGNTNFCQGGTSCLTDATSGGTWASTDNTVATVGTNGCVFGVNQGTAYIVYDVSGCSSITQVTINATAAITGPTAVCVGNTIALTDATAGVTWSSSNTTVATIGSSTGILTGNTNGTTTIIASSPLGCISLTTVTVNPNPGPITGTLGICIGLGSCLSDPTPGGTWSSSNGAVATIDNVTGCVTTVGIGTTIITYTFPITGCYTVTTVTVNPLPSAITGVMSVCATLTTALTDATTGGTWSSGNTSVATVNASGIVTGVAQGTANITYTSSLGCIVTAVVTVNSLAPITGTLDVCLGLTSTLSDAATGGTWSVSNANASIGSSSGVVTGLVLGVDTVIYTLPFGCVATAFVTVDPIPAGINGNATVCVGLTTSLTDGTSGGSWSTSTPTVALVDPVTGIVTGVSGGTSTITYMMPTGCMNTVVVTVNPVTPIYNNAPVCVGSTISLSDGTTGGTWSSTSPAIGSVDNFGNVTGVSAGTTTISYTLGSGCAVTVVVTVNPLPNPISGILSVCAWGGSTALTDAPAGGVWTSTLVVVNSTGVVTGYDTGVGTVSYILPTGCMATANVTVNPLPEPITGNTSVCVGSTTTLSDATLGGTWTSISTGVATIGSNTGVVTGVSGGTSVIVYVLPTGCASDTTVLVNPLPSAITGIGTVCVGSTTALTDGTSGGTWSSSDNTTATVDASGVVTGVNAAAGTATITYTLPTSCYVTTVVTVNPLPGVINGTPVVCMGSTTTLTDVTSGGTWSTSNTAIDTVDATGDVYGVSGGVSTITYTLSTGCYVTQSFTVNPIYAISGNAAVCYGQTTSLSDTATGGTWTSANSGTASVGSSTGIVTGNDPLGGTVTITYTLSTGCTATIVVTVNTLPQTISGPGSVCVGQTITLTDLTAGGNWSSSNSSIATVGATGIVTGMNAGTVTITYTNSTTNCYTTTTITVNPLSAITGTTSVCQGSTISLSDGTTGGTWSSSNTAVGTVDGFGNVYGVSAGTTTISYSLASGCVATTTVTVNAFGPITGGNSGVCVGLSINLSDAASGGIWTSSNSGIASVGSISGTVTGVSNGVVTITYTLPSGCTATTTVTVNSLQPITGPDSVCVGSSITLSDLTTGGTWSTNNGNATVSSTGVVTGNNSGTTIVSYSYGSSCYQIFSVVVNPMSGIYGNPNVCPGLTTQLSDSTVGGTWSASNGNITIGSSTGLVTGVTDGTTVVTYTSTTGCTATVVVTVDIVYPITGNTSICLGTTTSLSDITAGGTWSSSNVSVATVSSTGIVTGSSINAGTATITFTLPGGCIALTTVTVNPYPAPITGPTQVCLGSTITLSDITPSGSWSTTVATIDLTGDLTGVLTGVASVTYELPTGCAAYYTVTVNPLPSVILGNLSVCQGSSTTLSDAGGGTWSSQNTSIATVGSNTGVVNGISQGNVNITYTLSTGCYVDTLFTVLPIPTTINGVASVCVGLTTSLTDITPGGTWSSSNGHATIGSGTGIVTGASAGTSIITYTLSTGCYNTTVVTVNPLPANITGPTSVCVGQFITLSDVSGGGTWSSGDITIATIGSSSGIVTGVAGGVVNITYTLATGCIIATPITVNPLSAITGNPSVCIGLTTNLTDVGGGTWSSSNNSVASVDVTGVVTGNNVGTAIISYVLSTGCTTTMVVTVNPLPTAILGSLTTCVGQTTSLSDGSAGGTWISSNTGVATVGSSSGIVFGQSAGTAIITYTLGSSCDITAIVTVNALAPITGPGTVCEGQTISLNDAVGGGTWSSSNTGVATVGSSGIVTGMGTGTATISYILSTGCTATLTVTVNHLGPINGSGDLCVGVTTIFTDTASGGTWASSNPFVASVGSNTGIVSGNNGGVATISYIMPSGCTATLTITVNTLSPINGVNSICQGSSTLLTDITAGGVWSSSDTSTASISSTGVVNGNNSGTAIISYAYGPACVVYKSISVDPSSPIMGNLNVCLGLTTHLSDTTAGGTWSTSNISIATVNLTTGVVFGVNVGTAVITYTNFGTGCFRTAVVTVNMTGAITGMDSVCVGLTTTLSDVTLGSTWSSSNTGIATVGSSTGVVTGVAAGTAIITCTSPLGCIATVEITVNPLPTAVLGNPAVCVGLTTTLSDATPGGSWSSSNTTVATIDPATGLVTGINAGTATITYTLPTTCIATVVVTVNPLPAAISGTLAVCVGSATTLTDASGGGTWSLSNGNANVNSITGTVVGVTAGLDTVTYTLGTGCIITAVVTVNPLPSAILGNPNICLGSTNLLSDTTLGGSWSSSDASIGSIDASGNATGVSLGTAVITYTLPTGCIAIMNVTVDPLPVAISGIDSVCQGSTTTLSDGTGGGTWSSSDGTIATVGSNTGVVTGIAVAGGTVTITYTVGTGCYITTTVTVDPLPNVIAGNFNVCIGTSNTLTDATGGGVWSSSDTSVAPIDSITGVVFGHNLGLATITYTIPTGGCFVTQQVTVDPLPLPIAGPGTVCVGSQVTLTDPDPMTGTWSSSLVDTATIGNTTGIVTGIHSGTTTITYTLLGTGCIITRTETVNPLPDIIHGPSTVCVQDSVHLTDNTPNGLWSSQNTAIATVNDTTGEVYGIGSGTVYISYTLPTTCYVTFLETVNPLPPAITGDSVVCVAATITLSDASVGGTWTSSQIDTASIGASSGIVTGLHSGTTTITYTSNLFCITKKVITVNPIPTPILGIPSICAGFTRALSDTTAGGVWSSSDGTITGLATFGTNGVHVTGISAGTDSVFYTFPTTGCHVYVLFTVHPIPVITATNSSNSQICIGGNVTLSASGAGPGGQYAWSPASSVAPNTGTPVTASPSVTTTYTVIGTTQYGCSHDTTVTVFVDSVLLHIHITGKDSICAGECDTLVASGFTGSLFAWSPATDLQCLVCDTTVACATATHIYTATAVDSFGCHYSTSFKVTVNPLPVITVRPNPAIVCRGSSTQLTASGAATYTWFPNAFLSCDSCANPVASDTQNLVYNVIGTSQYGCRDSILVPVSVLDTTKNTISNDTIICLGSSAQLIASSTSVDGSHPDYYLWIPSTGLNDPNIPNPVATPDTTTNYELIIKENACFSDTEHVIVYVEPYPAFNITTSLTVVAGTSVQLGANIINEVLLTDYEWTPSTGLSCEKCFNPIATPSVNTTYTFTATSNYGCISNGEVTINLTCDQISQIFIPNTFTPNGDGVNDRFYVSGKGIGSVISLKVFNRWGEMVFQSANTSANDPGAGWDGTYKGIVLEPDVFMYVVEVTCELGGQPFKYKGDISIVR